MYITSQKIPPLHALQGGEDSLPAGTIVQAGI
jgi:hypothetical protein